MLVAGWLCICICCFSFFSFVFCLLISAALRKMEKAAKAIKRGSIKLKSFSDLHLILSDLQDMRTAGRDSVRANQLFVQDLTRWSSQQQNENLKELFPLLTELNLIWTEIHDEFYDNLKKFKQQIEMILESEQAVDKVKNNAVACEKTATKIQNEIRRSSSRISNDELRRLEEKLNAAEQASNFARFEVQQKVNENEVIKLIRLKEGMKKLTESYSNLSTQCGIVMQAQKVVVNELPDGLENSCNESLSTGCTNRARQEVSKAKTVVRAIGCSSGTRAVEYEPPPPYSPYYDERNVQGPSRNDPRPSCDAPACCRQCSVGTSHR